MQNITFSRVIAHPSCFVMCEAWLIAPRSLFFLFFSLVFFSSSFDLEMKGFIGKVFHRRKDDDDDVPSSVHVAESEGPAEDELPHPISRPHTGGPPSRINRQVAVGPTISAARVPTTVEPGPGGFVHDYFPPSDPYVKPSACLVAVPHGGIKVVKADSNAAGGVWRLKFGKVVLVEETNYFAPEDHVILSIKSGKDDATHVTVGPFALSGDGFPKEGTTVDISVDLGSYISFGLEAATKHPDAHCYLAHTGMTVDSSQDVGSVMKPYEGKLDFTLNHRMGRVEPQAGIWIEPFSATLLRIDRPKDAVIEQIYVDGKFGDAILFNENITASFRLTLTSSYKGEWWALSVDNKARENVSVPHCGGVKEAIVSGVSCDGHPGASDLYNGKPLAFFLKSQHLTRILPRIENWQKVLPILSLEVFSFVEQSRRYNTDVIKLKTRLTFNGKEVHPWYNFDSWGVAYPHGNNSQESSWDTYGEEKKAAENLRQRLQNALNDVVGVWVDVPKKLMVVYGDEAVLDGVAIRAMHVTIPLNDDMISNYFPNVPPPRQLNFEV